MRERMIHLKVDIAYPKPRLALLSSGDGLADIDSNRF
jgi:hypothetical protein